MKRLFTIFLAFFSLISSISYSQPYWTSQNSGTSNTLYGIKFTDPSTGYIVGETGLVKKSINGGTTWTTLPVGTTQTLRGLSFLNNNTGYIAGDSGVLRKTTNGGTNWFVLTSGFTLDLNSIHAVNANTVFACGDNGLIIKTTNAGINWFTQSAGTVSNLNSIHFLNSNTGCAVGNNSTIRKTTNGGSSWFTQSVGVTGLMTGVYLADATRGVITFSGSNVNFYVTNNGGTTWTPQFFGNTFTTRCIDFVDGIYGYVGGDVGSYYTTGNGSSTWVQGANGTSNWTYGISFVNPTTGWRAGTNGSILKTTNGGTPAPEAPTNLVASVVSGNQIFLSWFDNSNDEQGFKIERSIGMPTDFDLIGLVGNGVQNFIDTSGLVYGTRYYYRVYAFSGAGNSPYSNVETIVLTNITQSGTGIPDEYRLYNNYPNPFNPATTIKFDLPESGNVDIRIFDISGAEVDMLLNQNMNAGSYDITYNAGKLSSGVYFYKVTMGNFTDTKKMILLK